MAFFHPLIGLLMAGAMIVIVATGLHHIVELPAKRLLRQVLRRSDIHLALAAPAE